MDQGEEYKMHMLVKQIGHLYMQRAVVLQQQNGLITGGGRWGILHTLKHQNGLSQKELADKMGLKPPSITVALRKLEKEGYIRREQDAKDLRIIHIYLSDKGREQADRSHEIMNLVMEELFEGIEEEQIEQAKRLLVQMRDNLINREGMEDVENFPRWKR